MRLPTRHSDLALLGVTIAASTVCEILKTEVAGDGEDFSCGVGADSEGLEMTTRHRLNRGGHRQANAALHRTVIVRMQHHEPTRAYVARRTLEGRTKPEIIRCLKRHLAREIWAHMRPLRATAQPQARASSQL